MRNLPFKGYIYFSVILNVVSIMIIVVLKNFLPPVVPLFYGLPTGVEQLSPTLGLIIAPIAGLVITAINIFLSNLTKDSFLKRILIVSCSFISLLVFVAVIKIILLVGFF